jgi:hypothetical protein
MTTAIRSILRLKTTVGLLIAILCLSCAMPPVATAANPFGARPSKSDASADAGQQDSKVRKDMQAQAKTGFPLQSEKVADNVSVEAVMLPAAVCRRVFGREISENYAAVELTISNRSQDESLIVHSVFIDYSAWALSGSQYLDPKSPGGNPPQPWQAQTVPNQISSVEYRVARGELLDAQPWTTRNIVMRALQAAGAVASAYSFSLSEQGIIRGISAFSGQVVPAAEAFWPDGTIGQMNRISDLGFQTNKVIPKGSSDIIVAFFPLDRFLTPGLKKLFIKSPALFFSPYALLFDPEGKKLMSQFLGPTLTNMGVDPNTFLSELPVVYLQDYGSPAASCAPPAQEHPKTCQTMKFLAHASLNTVRVVIGGDMTVDVSRIPPTIAAIAMDEGNDNAATWKKGKDHKGAIQGTFLSDGTPAITDPAAFSKTSFTVDTSTTTSKELHFTMKLDSDVPSGQNLTFTVTKSDKGGNTVVSTPFVLPVVYASPSLSNAIVKGKALTITGSKLADAKKAVLSDTGKTDPDITLDNTATPGVLIVEDTEVDIDLSKAKDLASGCWLVKLQMADDSQTNGVLFPQSDAKACVGKKPPQ